MCVCVCVCVSVSECLFFSQNVIFRHAILAFNRPLYMYHNFGYRYKTRFIFEMKKSYKKIGLFALYICFRNYNL